MGRASTVVVAEKAQNARLRGRPRDPGIDDRVLDAAIALYAESGWAGFTFEAIARRTAVGKASLYGRWPNRGDLLRQTLETRWIAVEKIDSGSLRCDLTALAGMIFDSLTNTHGGVARWMSTDVWRYPVLKSAVAPFQEAAVKQGRAIARRAIARGELKPSINPGLLMDLLVGAVRNHVGNTPDRLRPAMIAKRDMFIDSLVDAVLLGVGAGTSVERFPAGSEATEIPRSPKGSPLRGARRASTRSRDCA